MKINKIRLLRVDDWAGLYINDSLVLQGHELQTRDIIQAFFPEIDFKSVWLDDLEEYGNYCPETWLDELESKE